MEMEKKAATICILEHMTVSIYTDLQGHKSKGFPYAQIFSKILKS